MKRESVRGSINTRNTVSGLNNLPEPLTVRVRYSHVDRMNYLYHVHYYEYCEWARTEWLRQIYKPYAEIEADGKAIVVTSAQLAYLKPARYDDLLSITVKPVSWGGSRFKLGYTVHRGMEPNPLFTAETTHCFVDLNGKPTAIPDDLKELVKRLYYLE